MHYPARGQRAEWREVYRLEGTRFYALDCLDQLNCVAAGHQSDERALIVVTSDGGVTWKDITIDDYDSGYVAPAPRPRSVSYPSPGVIAVGGDGGIVWITFNGGNTITKRRIGPKIVESIRMYDRDTGFSGLLFTTDGWQTTRSLPLPDSLSSSVAAGLAISISGDVFINLLNRTRERFYLLRFDIDGTLIEISSAPQYGQQITLTDDGFMASTGGRVINRATGLSRMVVSTSVNFGRDWQISLDTLTWQGLGGETIHFANKNFGAVAGLSFQIWSTTNGGGTWTSDTMMNLPSNALSVAGLYCFADGTCLAAMGHDIVARRFMHASTVSIPGDLTGLGGVNVIPNPAKDRLMLTVEGDVSAEATLDIVDLLGRERSVRMELRDGFARTEWIVDCSSLPKGMYLGRIDDRGNTRTIVFQIQ